MKLFLDTADVDRIRKLAQSGLVDGITTNPTLILKSGREQKKAIEEICSIVDGPVSVEGIGESAEQMIRDAKEFSKWAPNVVVKIPMTAEGMKAVQRLKAEGISTNVTLVFSSTQALLAAKAGATYVSPFIGRLDDASENGMQLVAEIAQIYANYGFETQIIVASIRHPKHVVDSAMLGAHIATMPPEIFEKLFKHPLTDKGIQMFLEDYKKTQNERQK